MRKHTLYGAVGAVLFSFSPSMAAAEEVARQAPEDDGRLTIVITGSRMAETVDETLVPVSVITREEIEERQQITVDEALSGSPGLTLSNSGGLGKLTTLSLRGTASDQVLVLLDGVKINSATSGIAAIQNLPLAQVEKIEVVRGPSSSLYGSEAIGGVIQLFTRKGREGFHPEFSLGGGSYSTWTGNIGASGGQGSAWYRINLSGIDSDGFNACNGKPFPDGAGCFTYEPDQDGYTNRSLSLGGGFGIGDSLELDARYLQSDNDVAYDGGFTNEGEYRQRVFGLNAGWTLSDAWNLLLKAGRAEDDLDDFLNGEFKSRFDTTRDQYTLQAEYRGGARGSLVFGADHFREGVGGTTDYTVDSRRNTGLFAQYRNDFGANGFQVSIRNDDYDDFGSQTTGGLAYGRALNDWVRFTASWGSAFRAPSFNELYYPYSGNPGLDPETSESFDLGLAGSRGPSRWSINLFWTEIDDLIAYDVAVDRVANIDEARIRGVEFAGSHRAGDWRFSGSLTLLDAENRADGPFRGKDLARRPAASGRLDVDRQWGRFTLGASLHGQGSSYDDLANTRKLDGFVTVDLRGEYALADDWVVAARVGNLFDREYETAAFYNQPGLNGMLTVRYTPR